MEVDQFKAKFRVKIVRDAWNNELSLQEAAENGIIDTVRYQYINKKTGEKCSVPEAIQKGLIVQMTPMERIAELRQGGQARTARRMSSFVTPTDREQAASGEDQNQPQSSRLGRSYSLRETGAKRRVTVKPRNSVVGCFYGLISFRNKIRTVKYSILRVRDTKSEETWSFQKAKAGGIIDTKTQMFIDSKDNTSMSFLEAIENDLIEIETKQETVQDDEGNEFDHYIVYGVMDSLEKRRITFKEALENFVLVSDPPVYRDTLNHVDMHLYDAIEQRLVVAKPMEPNSVPIYDRMISDENRLETDRERRVLEFEE